MNIYAKLLTKQFDITSVCLWSLFISYLIKNAYSALHSFIWVTHDFNEYTKVILYIVSGSILPFVVLLIYNSTPFKWLLLKTNHQTIHSDIFDDVIDYNKKTSMYIYLKNTNYYFAGTFLFKEQTDNNPHIVLIDYVLMDINTDEVIYEPTYHSSVVISLSDTERIELIYESESELWKSWNKCQTNDTSKKEDKKKMSKSKKLTKKRKKTNKETV